MKRCFCETCARCFHPLGIARHRAMHRDRFEDCIIRYSGGERYRYQFSKSPRKSND